MAKAEIADVEWRLAASAPPEPDPQSEPFAKVGARPHSRPTGRPLPQRRAGCTSVTSALAHQRQARLRSVGVVLADHVLYQVEADLR